MPRPTTKINISIVEQPGERYELILDGRHIGTTDEYGTCIQAAPGWTTVAIEQLTAAIES